MKTIDKNALDAIAQLAVHAGAAIMAYRDNWEAAVKADGSPVTQADAAAEAIVTEGLERLFPGTPVIAEEACAAGVSPEPGNEFFLVDPLDGTKEFISGNDDFTVNIGLVRNGAPVSGVIFAPATGRLWMSICGPSGGSAAGMCEACDITPGAKLSDAQNRRAIHVRPLPQTGLVVAASRSHLTLETEAYISALPIAERRTAGSSLKFCLIAEGQVDMYPRFGPTMEWDTCAGHAILAAAGGTVCTPEGAPIRYGNRENNYKNSDFIAVSDYSALRKLVLD